VSTFILNGGDGYKFEALKRQRFSEYSIYMTIQNLSPSSCETLPLLVEDIIFFAMKKC
jgi:hypothetical protein